MRLLACEILMITFDFSSFDRKCVFAEVHARDDPRTVAAAFVAKHSLGANYLAPSSRA